MFSKGKCSGALPFASLRSRRSEVNGRKKERARTRCPLLSRAFFLAPVYFLAPATQATILPPSSCNLSLQYAICITLLGLRGCQLLG